MAENTVMQEFYFTSSFRGKMRQMSGRLWRPAPETQITEDGEFYYTQPKPRALIQILHDMREHSGRYDETARFLAGTGFLVFAHDQAGHGGSMESEGMPGYFDDFKGWDRLVEDALELKRGVAPSYPDCPVYLFGHGLGSFVAQTIAARYGGDYDGFIFCGPAGKNSSLSLARLAAKAVCSTKGKRKPSPFLDKLIFGTFNNRIDNAGSRYSWLTRDEKALARYEQDPLCGFTFTGGGFQDLFEGLHFLESPEWPGQVPEKPILLIAGEEDPAGNYGKGAEEMAEGLKACGHSKVLCHLYPGMRHDILQEIGKEEVYLDIFHWLEEQLNQNNKKQDDASDDGENPVPSPGLTAASESEEASALREDRGTQEAPGLQKVQETKKASGLQKVSESEETSGPQEEPKPQEAPVQQEVPAPEETPKSQEAPASKEAGEPEGPKGTEQKLSALAAAAAADLAENSGATVKEGRAVTLEEAARKPDQKPAQRKGPSSSPGRRHSNKQAARIKRQARGEAAADGPVITDVLWAAVAAAAKDADKQGTNSDLFVPDEDSQ